jgi:hypothetical protein
VIGLADTHVFVRNNLDALHMTGGLKDLLQDIFRHPRIQTAHIQSSLVGLRGRSAHIAARTGRRHHIGRQRGGDGGWDGVCILRNHHRRQRRRWHVGRIALAVALSGVKLLLAWSARGLLGRRWEGRGGRRRRVFCHGETRSEAVTIIRYRSRELC